MAVFQKRAPLKPGYSMKRLWKNANPVANFPAQTLSMDLSEYQALLVAYAHYVNPSSTTVAYNCEGVISLDNQYTMDPAKLFASYQSGNDFRNILYTEANTSNSTGCRNFLWNDDGVVFLNCTAGSAGAQNRSVPEEIYGIRFNPKKIDTSITTLDKYLNPDNYFDNISIYSYTGDSQFDRFEDGTWEIKLLTSGEFKMLPHSPTGFKEENQDLFYDVLLIGGGGSGGGGGTKSGGGGGGAGYMKQVFHVPIPAGVSCTATIGAGGEAVKGAVDGNDGNNTIFKINFGTNYLDTSAYYAYYINYNQITPSTEVEMSRLNSNLYAYGGTGGKCGVTAVFTNTSNASVTLTCAMGGDGSSGGGGGLTTGTYSTIPNFSTFLIPGEQGENTYMPHKEYTGTYSYYNYNINGTGTQQNYSTDTETISRLKGNYYTSKWHNAVEWVAGGGGGGGTPAKGGCAGDAITANGLVASGTVAASGGANTGAGGGGARGNGASYLSGAGGSGIIIIRPHQGFNFGFEMPLFVENNAATGRQKALNQYMFTDDYVYYRYPATGEYNFTALQAGYCDIFACGGGAGGKGGGAYGGNGGKGGGGGYTDNKFNQYVTTGSTVVINVGAGGAAGKSGTASTVKYNGNVILTANGGTNPNGGSGGGGGGGSGSAKGGVGGTNGGDGGEGGTGGGGGQGTTTAMFNDASIDGLYYGGGGAGGSKANVGGNKGGASGGGNSVMNSAGKAGTNGLGGGGGGGNGGSSSNSTSEHGGGAGGCGCVVIRVPRSN